MIETLVISLFFLLIVGASVYAALVPHTLHCIIGLGIVLFGVAGVFLYLGSPFVAAIQILIYIGGISVAMLFALMLSVSLSRPIYHSRKKVLASVAIALSFFAVMAALVITAEFPLREEALAAEAWSPARIGQEFLTTYNLVFQGLALALLIAIMGAVLIAKRQEGAR